MANVEFRFESSVFQRDSIYRFGTFLIRLFQVLFILTKIERLLSSVQVLQLLEPDMQAAVHYHQDVIPEPANCPALPLVVGQLAGHLAAKG